MSTDLKSASEDKALFAARVAPAPEPQKPAPQLEGENPSARSVTMQTTDIEPALEFTYHIITTHFSTFTYVDTKLQALLAISSVFLAGSTLFLTKYDIKSPIALLLLIASAILLVLSILICVWHVVPKMNSGLGNEDNPRSAIGTTPLTKQQYYEKIRGLSKEKMLEYNCYQISGLSRIHMRGARALKASSSAIAVSVVMFCIAFAINGMRTSNAQDKMQPILITTSLGQQEN